MQASETAAMDQRAKAAAERFLNLLDRELAALRTLNDRELHDLSEEKQREAAQLAEYVAQLERGNEQLSPEFKALLRMCETGNARNGILIQQGLRQTEQMLSILRGEIVDSQGLLYQKNGAMLAKASGISPGISA